MANAPGRDGRPVTIFGPDFPFPFDDWIAHRAGLGSIPAERHGEEVAVIGAGISGLVAAYELMKLGVRPVVYEASQMGGRLRSQPFEGAKGVVAELGGMRFPISSSSFYYYVNKLGLQTLPFPNPLTEAAGSTVVDLEGETYYAGSLGDLPPLFTEVAEAWAQALEEARFTDIQNAIRARDVATLKSLWNDLVPRWDDRTFYDFVATSQAFSKLTFRHREVFGQVGFGTGGWDSDFPNSMLEIFRVVMTNCDSDQHLIVGGAAQVPRGLWRCPAPRPEYWPAGTSLASLHSGAPRPGVARIAREPDGRLAVTDEWGTTRRYAAVLVTCQSWLLTTQIECEESLFSAKLWTALDRTRYMQSSKTFVLVDRPFWKDKDPRTGRDVMSMTLTDRLTRGTYLFDNGDGQPGVICLTYSWMSDALKMLPEPVERRVQLALNALSKIYPDVDIASHIIGDPITVSWEADRHFLGAFKGALPGHYRYNHRMYAHFMQDDLPPEQRGIFLAGDDVSWTPAWVEGAVQTSLNAVWGILHHLGGTTHADNPGPGDVFARLAPLELPRLNQPIELTVGGRLRRFALHLPRTGSGGGIPLVIVLHGNHPDATGQMMRDWTTFDEQAGAFGFAVAYPDGIGGCWADGRGVTTADEAGVDDVAFLRALIDTVAARHGTHPDRAVVAGVSNGAFMAHRIALEASEKVAVFAAVAGGLPASLRDARPAHAVSAMLIHGTADPISPIEGGYSRHRGPNGELRGRTLSLAETAGFWRSVDRCPPGPGDTRTTEFSSRNTAAGGVGGTRVAAWTVLGGGHTWPGAKPFPGAAQTGPREFDAAEEICRFAVPLLAPADSRRL